MYPPRFVIHVQYCSAMKHQNLQLSFECGSGSTNLEGIEICLPLIGMLPLILLNLYKYQTEVVMYSVHN